MKYVYRAYRDGQGFPSHDSAMPKNTWNKVARRKENLGVNGGRPPVEVLKGRGWEVRRVGIVDYSKPAKDLAEDLRKFESEVPRETVGANLKAALFGLLLLFILSAVTFVMVLSS